MTATRWASEGGSSEVLKRLCASPLCVLPPTASGSEGFYYNSPPRNSRSRCTLVSEWRWPRSLGNTTLEAFRNVDVSLQCLDVVLHGRNRLKFGLLPSFPVPSP